MKDKGHVSKLLTNPVLLLILFAVDRKLLTIPTPHMPIPA